MIKSDKALKRFNGRFKKRDRVEAGRGILIYFWVNPIRTSEGLKIGNTLLPYAMIKNHNESQYSVSFRLCDLDIRAKTLDLRFEKNERRIDFSYIRKIEITELFEKSR